VPARRPHHRLHRRKRIERAADPGQDLGAQGPDPGAAVRLQLEAAVGHRWRELLEFLQALTRQIRGKLLVIWDGLPAHRSRVVKDYVEGLDGHLVLERLPAYAPELNPVEYLWGYLKQRELANLCLHNIAEVGAFARNRLKSMQRRPRLITAFWQQAELPL